MKHIKEALTQLYGPQEGPHIDEKAKKAWKQYDDLKKRLFQRRRAMMELQRQVWNAEAYFRGAKERAKNAEAEVARLNEAMTVLANKAIGSVNTAAPDNHKPVINNKDLDWLKEVVAMKPAEVRLEGVTLLEGLINRLEISEIYSAKGRRQAKAIKMLSEEWINNRFEWDELEDLVPIMIVQGGGSGGKDA